MTTCNSTLAVTHAHPHQLVSTDSFKRELAALIIAALRARGYSESPDGHQESERVFVHGIGDTRVDVCVHTSIVASEAGATGDAMRARVTYTTQEYDEEVVLGSAPPVRPAKGETVEAVVGRLLAAVETAEGLARTALEQNRCPKCGAPTIAGFGDRVCVEMCEARAGQAQWWQ